MAAEHGPTAFQATLSAVGDQLHAGANAHAVAALCETISVTSVQLQLVQWNNVIGYKLPTNSMIDWRASRGINASMHKVLPIWMRARCNLCANCLASMTLL